MRNNHSSIYMRGLFDGLREGMSPEMTPKKFKLTLDSMTAIGRKIFEATPIQEAWTVNQIVTGMSRTSSTRVDMKTATGCLDTLKQAGLVKEVERGLFRQVVPREQTPYEALKDRAEGPIDAVTNAIPPEAHPNFSKKITLADSREILPGSADGSIKPVFPDNSGDQSISPAAKFGDLAVALRLKGQSLIRMADEMDEAALAFEQQVEDANKRLERFNTLKALLTEA